MLHYHTVPVTPFQQNCSIVWCDATHQAAVIDPGGDLDLLLAEVPLVLRAELYAVAALAGASVVAMGSALGFPLHLTAPAGAALCFGLRMMALHYGWHLPMALQASRSPPLDNPPDSDTPR